MKYFMMGNKYKCASIFCAIKKKCGKNQCKYLKKSKLNVDDCIRTEKEAPSSGKKT